MAKIVIRNPKRDHRSQTRRAHWYPYYAGFSDDFAVSLLNSMNLSASDIVFDPWNGSGTTTLSAASIGLRSIGHDLNPIMVLVAKARLLGNNEKPSMAPLAAEILAESSRNSTVHSDCEPLETWFFPSSAAAIRSIEIAIQKILISEEHYTKFESRNRYDDISSIASFFYVALFRTLRRITGKFSSTNPTWTKLPRSVYERIRPTKVKINTAFKIEVELMSESISDPSLKDLRKSTVCEIGIGNSTNIDLESESIDITLTSPPYCTRIDYAAATRIELAALGFETKSGYDDIRREMIGTTTVEQKKYYKTEFFGPTCRTFLDKLMHHKSKASKTYYYKNHIQYYLQLEQSIREISRVTKIGGDIILVAQDSYYKDLKNDLPSMIAEMSELNDLILFDKINFNHKRTMAGINSSSREYRKEFEATESVLWFKRG